jgi:hypothetical protein
MMLRLLMLIYISPPPSALHDDDDGPPSPLALVDDDDDAWLCVDTRKSTTKALKTPRGCVAAVSNEELVAVAVHRTLMYHH